MPKIGGRSLHQEIAKLRRRMRYFILVSIIFSSNLFSGLALAASAEEKGTKIAEVCDKSGRGFKGESSSMKMEIISSGGDKIFRNMSIKRKEMDEDGDRMILLVENPPDVKGTKLLTWSHKTQDDEQWLYLPSLKRVKRITAQLKSGSFMGSEFSYEDISQKEFGKFKYKFIKDDEIDGRKTWVVQRISKKGDSGYSREVIWYDHEYKSPVKTEFFDRRNELMKVAEISGYKKYNDRWWQPQKIKMSNVQTKNQSMLIWSQRKLQLSIPSDAFLSENLKD